MLTLMKNLGGEMLLQLTTMFLEKEEAIADQIAWIAVAWI